jgi:methyl-accepting chemotaxis protein
MGGLLTDMMRSRRGSRRGVNKGKGTGINLGKGAGKSAGMLGKLGGLAKGIGKAIPFLGTALTIGSGIYSAFDDENIKKMQAARAKERGEKFDPNAKIGTGSRVSAGVSGALGGTIDSITGLFGLNLGLEKAMFGGMESLFGGGKNKSKLPPPNQIPGRPMPNQVPGSPMAGMAAGAVAGGAVGAGLSQGKGEPTTGQPGATGAAGMVEGLGELVKQLKKYKEQFKDSPEIIASINQILPLIPQVTDLFDELGDFMEESSEIANTLGGMDVAGAIGQVPKVLAGSMEALCALAKVGAAFKDLMKGGTFVDNPYEDLAEELTEVMDQIGELITTITTMAGEVYQYAPVLDESLGKIPEVLGKIPSIICAILKIGGTFDQLAEGGVFTDNPIENLAEEITEVVDQIDDLIKIIIDMASSVGENAELLDNIMPQIPAVLGSIPPIICAILKIGEIFEQLAEGGVFTDSPIENLAEEITEVMDQIKDLIMVMIELGSAVSQNAQMLDNILPQIPAVLGSIPPIICAILKIGGIFGDMIKSGTFTDSPIENLAEELIDIADEITSLMEAFVELTTVVDPSMLEGMDRVVGTLTKFLEMMHTLTKIGSEFQDFLENPILGDEKLFTELTKKLDGVATDVIKLISSLTYMANSVMGQEELIQNLDLVPQFLKKLTNILSSLDEIGIQFAEQLHEEGFMFFSEKSKFETLVETLNSISQDIEDLVNSILDISKIINPDTSEILIQNLNTVVLFIDGFRDIMSKLNEVGMEFKPIIEHSWWEFSPLERLIINLKDTSADIRGLIKSLEFMVSNISDADETIEKMQKVPIMLDSLVDIVNKVIVSGMKMKPLIEDKWWIWERSSLEDFAGTIKKTAFQLEDVFEGMQYLSDSAKNVKLGNIKKIEQIVGSMDKTFSMISNIQKKAKADLSLKEPVNVLNGISEDLNKLNLPGGKSSILSMKRILPNILNMFRNRDNTLTNLGKESASLDNKKGTEGEVNIINGGGGQSGPGEIPSNFPKGSLRTISDAELSAISRIF